MSWYEVIKDFQELIGVTVGFIGMEGPLHAMVFCPHAG
jgi:hypothetical protein